MIHVLFWRNLSDDLSNKIIKEHYLRASDQHPK